METLSFSDQLGTDDKCRFIDGSKCEDQNYVEIEKGMHVWLADGNGALL